MSEELEAVQLQILSQVTKLSEQIGAKRNRRASKGTAASETLIADELRNITDILLMLLVLQAGRVVMLPPSSPPSKTEAVAETLEPLLKLFGRLLGNG